MEATKLQLKIFAEAGPVLSPDLFISVFHGWIKERVLPELMIDVANYAHVPKGPGVVLIGHASDYFMEEGEGRLGLLYSRKRMSPPPADRLSDTFRNALHAARLLQADPALAGKLRFRPRELLFRINDRLEAPNTDATFAAVRPELEALCARLFAGSCQLSRAGDPRSLFSVKITSPADTDLDTLLARLGSS